MTNKSALRVNEVGEYVRHKCCSRRFKLQLNNRQEARRLPFFERLFNALDPVLQEEGRKREESWESMLKEQGYVQIKEGAQEISWGEFESEVQSISRSTKVFARELVVEGRVGGWDLKGRIDFVLLDGTGRLRVVECKASRRDRTYHRMQVSVYGLLLENYLTQSPLSLSDGSLTYEDIDLVVARIDESTNTPQSILALEPLELEMERADLLELLSPHGPLVKIAKADLDELPYQLDQKCDGCVFNTDCLPESGLKRRNELLGLSPPIIRALTQVGINTIDELAELDPESDAAQQLNENPSFSESVRSLSARARTRRKNLPGESDDFEVTSIPNTGQGTLPEHEINGKRLVRVYLAIDYDYAENRIGSLAAHLTTSEGLVHTPLVEEDGNWKPHPVVCELGPDEKPGDRPVSQLPAISGEEVITYKSSPWSGNQEPDSGAERQLIEEFLHKLVDKMNLVATDDKSPVHFYVWSPGEITRLVESCTRVGSNFLRHLRHLMGCRESLEQLIYSSVGREVNQKFSLAWTGRGLSVAASLKWFGRSYHWTRNIGRNQVQLDRVFTQDIFDFKTTLHIDQAATKWLDRKDPNATKHLFEIRSRFFDSLSASYWRAIWNQLPDPAEIEDPKAAGMIERFKRAQQPNHLEEYLRARVHALRWLEEKCRKSRQIQKPDLDLPNLKTFLLNTSNVADAAVEFLRLDQHVRTADWVAEHVVPPSERVSSFSSIPIKNIRVGQNARVHADLAFDAYGVSVNAASESSSIGEGSFVRITPRPDCQHMGQNAGLLFNMGHTAVIESIDWENSNVVFSVIPFRNADQYRLKSLPMSDPARIPKHALIEENPSDFVAPWVDERLQSGLGTHVFEWLDPTNPEVPEVPAMAAQEMSNAKRLLDSVILPPTDSGLAVDQKVAILDGLKSRIQLLQGPPGTGKTHTSAVAVLLRILLRCDPDDIVIVAGPTHQSIDTLLERIVLVKDQVVETASQCGFQVPNINIAKVHSSDPTKSSSTAGITDLAFNRVTPINNARRGSVMVLGGLVSGLLKCADFLRQRATFRMGPDGTLARAIFVDEASMMVFPNFLALATLVEPDGEIIVAGDHRQLSPIVAHEWDQEDRPPSVLYKPFVSAYEAVRTIGQESGLNERQVSLTALQHSFRLPAEVRHLISRVYREDQIELEGRGAAESGNIEDVESPFENIWRRNSGLYLIIHNESESRKSNALEANIIREILDAGEGLPKNSVAIITPHRAQRILLNRALMDNDAVSLVDTVERMQGGEKPTVIVSATASDPSVIGANVEFLLNLNRSNVAFSRARERLIVVASKAILNFIPPELEDYQSSQLWKSLRQLCDQELAVVDIDGHSVSIRMCNPDAIEL